jgi:hypothetical protein
VVSCRAIQVFNHKLKKVANLFKPLNYNREYFTKHGMHLNRRGKRLVAKQLASEIWNLSAAEEMPPISLRWKTVQEQIVLGCAVVVEARKSEGDCLMDELKTVPDKLVEDKYVVDYPIDKPKTEPDMLYNSTTKAVRVSKRSKKPPITKKNDFYGKRKVFNR